MRRAARIDSNQVEIVQTLRALGASVAHTHTVKGFVDVVVGYRGRSVLVEIKDSNKPPSARKLTPMEAEFHKSWKGALVIIESKQQCEQLIKDLSEHAYPIEPKAQAGRKSNAK